MNCASVVTGLQDNVEPAAIARGVAKALLQPEYTLVLISSFRPVALQLSLALREIVSKLHACDTPPLHVAAVQILEQAPQLQG